MARFREISAAVERTQSWWRGVPGPVRYVAPRLVALAAAWLLATIAIFCTLYVFSDPLDQYASPAGAPLPAAQRAALRHELGLDHSKVKLYGDWLADMAHGDFGYDAYYRQDVRHQIRTDLEPSLELLVVGLVLGGAVGGLLAAPWRRSLGRSGRLAGRVAASVLASVPVFVAALFALIVLVDKWGYTLPFPQGHFYEHPADHLQLFGIAGAMVAIPVAASVALDLERGRRPIRWPAVLLATLAAIPVAISAAIVIEFVFTIPGLGLYLLLSATHLQTFGVRSVAAIVAFVALVAWVIPPRTRRSPESTSEAQPSVQRRPTLTRPQVIALAAVAVVAILAAVGPWVAPYNANAFLAQPNAAPSAHHLLGADYLGEDEFSRVLYAARGSLRIALPVVFVGLLPGVVLGALVGRVGSWLTSACAELADMCAGVPWLVALVVVVAAWPGRIEYMTAALSIGAFVWGLSAAADIDLTALRTPGEIARALTPPAIQRALAVAALAVLAEVTLSFLGVGQHPPAASLGSDFQTATNHFPVDYTLFIAIGAPLCLGLFVLHAARSVIRRT